MQARRDKGLCYNCDDKYSPGHRCKSRFFLLIHDDEEQPNPKTSPPESPKPDATGSAQLSLTALFGHFNPKMFRVIGRILTNLIRVLVDSGSSHNFLQSTQAYELGLPASPTKPLSVTVGNGHALTCSQVCTKVPLLIQEQPFLVDFYLIDLCWPEAILGVQWLQSLGPVLTDYEQLTMQFTWDGKMVKLLGETQPEPMAISIHQLHHLSH